MDVVAMSAALGNPTRYSIMKALRDESIVSCCDRLQYSEGGVCVGDVVKLTGLAQATVSQHLTVLERAGLVRKEKRDPWTCFFLNLEALDFYIKAVTVDLM